MTGENAVVDIDDIWSSMKFETLNSKASKKAESLVSLWESAPHSSKERKKYTRRKNQRSSTVLVPINKDLSGSNYNEDQTLSRVKWPEKEINVVVRNEMSVPPSLIREVDSDDETDDDSCQSEMKGKTATDKSIRLERCARVLRNGSLQERKETVQTLHDLIGSLSQSLQKIQPLNLPCPYDLSRISLTHIQRGSVISDLAKGDHVANWGYWQRTQDSPGTQFEYAALETRSGDETEKCSENLTENYNQRLDQLQTILNTCGAALFLLFTDETESCRARAISCVQMLCLSGIDIGRHIQYLLPVIFSRYPPQSYDFEMQLFVCDAQTHQYYQRGGAVMRQDQMDVLNGNRSRKMIEQSEEVRLMLCELISDLIWYLIQSGRTELLGECYNSIILSLICNTRDPFPAVKILASKTLVQLLRVPQFENEAKHFAIGIARSTIANLRHRNAIVRLSSIELFEAAVCVPDREKRKGAGSYAIQDLVGFREENVRPLLKDFFVLILSSGFLITLFKGSTYRGILYI